VVASYFTETGLLTQGQVGHSATLLEDGRVLIIGGAVIEGRPIATAEIWNPESKELSMVDSLQEEQSDHSATLLPDEQVLSIGGYDAESRHVSSAVL
jgi:hypothetical protein